MQLSAVLLGCLSAAGTATARQPTWPPTYDMKASTLFMPCNYSGFLDPSISAKWGVVDFDWSNAKGAWTRQQLDHDGTRNEVAQPGGAASRIAPTLEHGDAHMLMHTW